MLSLIIFVFQLLIYSLLVTALHYASPRIGLAPVLFLLAGIIGLLNVIELGALLVTLPNGVTLRPGGHIFIPIALQILLMLYVVQGTRAAQIAIIGIIGINVLVFMTLMFNLLYVNFPGAGTEIMGLFTDAQAFNNQFMRGMVASLVAFIADMLIMIIIYQGVRNHLKWIPMLIIPGIALILALWTDTVIYNVGAFSGTPNFDLLVPSDILVKTGAGLLLAPILGLYLTRKAPMLPTFSGADQRPVLAILSSNPWNDHKLETLETELRISRTVYNQLTQNIEEIFWLIDIEERRFIYVSPAYERITKYSVDPLYEDSHNLLQIIHEDDRAATNNDVVWFLTTERDVEFRIIQPGGTVRWVRARAFPIKDEAGTIIRYAGIAEDITERKRLTEQDFELALARERVQILHDFISDASHDLKTPISSIVLKLDLLERIEDADRRRVIRRELYGRAIHLSNLITDLFTLSRIEGHLEVDMTTIDLNTIVEGVLQEVKMLAEEKGLHLSETLTNAPTAFEGNAEQIHRVVSNLISNAIRYTHEGQIMVTTDSEKASVVLRVVDTGIGIAEEHLDHVFDRFFRTNRAKDTHDGTGLGLAICRAIVDNHHGQISVASKAGDGAVFTVRLPQQQPTETSIRQDMRRSLQEIRPVS